MSVCVSALFCNGPKQKKDLTAFIRIVTGHCKEGPFNVRESEVITISIQIKGYNLSPDLMTSTWPHETRPKGNTGLQEK